MRILIANVNLPGRIILPRIVHPRARPSRFLKFYFPRSPSLSTVQAAGYAVSSSYALRPSVRLRSVQQAVKTLFKKTYIRVFGRQELLRARACGYGYVSPRIKYSGNEISRDTYSNITKLRAVDVCDCQLRAGCIIRAWSIFF